MMLVGDIGGSNSRLALYDHGTGTLSEVRHRFNADFDRFPDLLRSVLTGFKPQHLAPLRCCILAVAGQAQTGRAHLTNRPEYQFDVAVLSRQLQRYSGSQVKTGLINDFQALAHALPFLTPGDCLELIPGRRDQSGPYLVMGPGTGLGLGILHRGADGRYRSLSAEGGHLGLPIRDTQDLALRDRLAERSGGRFVDAEYALAGAGLSRMYRVLAPDAQALTSEQVTAAAVSGQNPRARQAAETAVVWLYRLVAELALLYRPAGGVYLAGGVTRALLPYLQDPGLQAALYDDSRFARDLGEMPVALITSQNAALIGAGVFGSDA